MHDRRLENGDEEAEASAGPSPQRPQPLASSAADAQIVSRLREAHGAGADTLAPLPARPASYRLRARPTPAAPIEPASWPFMAAPRPLTPGAYGADLRQPTMAVAAEASPRIFAPLPARPGAYRVVSAPSLSTPPKPLWPEIKTSQLLAPLPLRPAAFGTQPNVPAATVLAGRSSRIRDVGVASVAAPLPARPASFANIDTLQTTHLEPPSTAVTQHTSAREEAATSLARAPMQPPIAPQAYSAPSKSNDVASTAHAEHNLAASTAVLPDEATRPTFWSQVATWLRRVCIFLALSLATWLIVMAALIGLYRFVDPPSSALMATQWAAGTSIDQRWRDIDAISPNLVRAVVVSEDWRFCQHYGVDLAEIEAAIARARNGTPRGASTITMQVAKNLFLWPAKSYVRKALEVPLTLMLETLWSKRRIAEVYLNVAEWGPGVFGAEAAARHHFSRSAAKLSAAQAALLAVGLPNPFTRVAGKPGRGTRRLARTIRARMRQAGTATDCILRP